MAITDIPLWVKKVEKVAEIRRQEKELSHHDFGWLHIEGTCETGKTDTTDDGKFRLICYTHKVTSSLEKIPSQ